VEDFTDHLNTSNIKNSNHKRVISNQNNYVKVQSSEIASQGTAENTTNAMSQFQLNNQQVSG